MRPACCMLVWYVLYVSFKQSGHFNLVFFWSTTVHLCRLFMLLLLTNSLYVFAILGRGLAVTYKWLLCFCNSFSHPNLLFWSSRFALAKDNSSLCSKATMIWGIVERLFAVGGCCSLLCPTATTFKMSQWLDTVNQLSMWPSGDAATVLNNSYRFLLLVAGANSRHTVCQKQGYQFHLWSCIESKVPPAVPWLCIKSRVVTVILWLCIKK